MTNDFRYEAVVIGVSAGGLNALKNLLPEFSPSFPLPVIVVQHRDAHSGDFLVKYLNDLCHVTVKEVDDHDPIQPGIVYLAPANYHILVEDDRSLSLSIDEPVKFARPSIDVLFESAAEVYREGLIGVILTGANSDGSHGLKMIKNCGGMTVVEDPATAETPTMPQSALAATMVDYVLPLRKIGPLLCALSEIRRGKKTALPW